MSEQRTPARVVGGSFEISVQMERLVLHPEKAVWWPGRRTVFIADTHFGKTATFRAHGVPIGDETLEHDLERLSKLVAESRCERLVILGDLIHARRGRSPVTLDRITAWRRRHRELAIEMVKGNHDRGAGPPVEEWEIRMLPDSFREGPFVYRHDPISAEEGFVLAGHLHPKAVLPMEAGGKAKLACFWVRERVMVLPAFGSFIDSAAVEPAEGDAVYAVAEGAVHDVTVLVTVRGR
jgi:DNA ligase-associated metallophosphoesterase